MGAVRSRAETGQRKRPFPPGILVDNQILSAMHDHHIDIEPFERACLEPATYDMRLGDIAAVSTASTPINLKEHKFLNIEPGAMAIVQTLEVLQLSDTVAGRIGPKTDLLRRGVFASTGPQIDPGFNGRLIVNLINLSPRPFALRYEEPFLTIEFHQLSGKPDKSYQGEYQGRTELGQDELDILLAYRGPTLAEIYRGFGELKTNLRNAADWTGQTGEVLKLLKELSSAIGGQQKGPAMTLQINSLQPEPFKLLQPIPVLIQPQGPEWVASFYDANLHASGETEQEAFDNLRSVILDVFESLGQDKAELGPGPAKQIAVLRTFIEAR